MKGLRVVFIIILLAIALCIGYYLFLLPAAIAPFLNSMLMLVLPLALAVFLFRRYKVEWGLFGIGALTFIGSQILHIPFNQWTLNPLMANLGLQPANGGIDLIVVAILLGLSAGVFEETARYVVYARWLEKARSCKEGLMFGAGHGGTEAMILGVLVLLNLLQMLTLQGDNLTNLVPPEQLEPVQAAVNAYWAAPWYEHLLPAVERIAAMTFHLSAALLVMRAFTHRNILWYLTAVLWHTTINAVAVFGVQTWGPLVTEGLIVIGGLISLWIILALRPATEETPPQESESSESPPPLALASAEVPPEKLEDSRYDG